MRDPSAPAAHAAEAIPPEPPPRLLLVTTRRWYSVARLSLAAAQAGFVVEMVCPLWPEVARLDAIDRVHRYSTAAPHAGLRRAIHAAKPDLIIPCDDLAAATLRTLYARLDAAAQGDASIKDLIVRSLGHPAHFDGVLSRVDLMTLAETVHVRVPLTRSVEREEDLSQVAAQVSFPAMVKSDGSSGGLGVTQVQTLAEAKTAFQTLKAPPTFRAALRRSILDGDHGLWAAALGRRGPQISLQAFAAGRPGTTSVACWQGEVLDMVAVKVLETAYPNGPATVVRYVENPDMIEAVHRIVRRLGLSGLCGFDFILSDDDGAASLIEINPRATPMAHLSANDGGDLMQLLLSAVCGVARPKFAGDLDGQIVVMFPGEIRRDPASRWLDIGRHDRPDACLELIELAGADAWAPREGLPSRSDEAAQHDKGRDGALRGGAV